MGELKVLFSLGFEVSRKFGEEDGKEGRCNKQKAREKLKKRRKLEVGPV